MTCVAVMVMLYICVLRRFVSRPTRILPSISARHDTHRTSLWVTVQVETDVLVSVLCRQLGCSPLVRRSCEMRLTLYTSRCRSL